MKNFVYSFLLLAACSSSHTNLNPTSVIEELDDDSVVLEDTISSENTVAEFPLVPNYPLNYYGPDACLPSPTPAFLDGRRAGTLHGFTNPQGLFLDEIYLYLEMALDTVSSKHFYSSPYSSTSLVWGQEFENGIYYLYEELESGGGIEIWTHCRDKDAFFHAIDLVVNEEIEKEESYGWNTLHTEYGPLDDGAGCYYTLETDSLGYCHLTSYCGC